MPELSLRPPATTQSVWGVAVLLLLVFVSMIGLGVVVPLLPYYGALFDAEAWQVTLLFATSAAGQFLGELTWGRLSDRVGRRPVILMTILMTALGYLALAFAPNIWVAILARGFSGFFSGNISTIQSYVVDVTPPDRLPGRLGMIGAAIGVGFVVGPTLGGLLAEPEMGLRGFQPPLFVATALSVLAALGALLFLRESRKAVARGMEATSLLVAIKEALSEPVLQRLLLSTFIAFTGFSSIWAVVGLWGFAEFGWRPRVIGLLMAMMGAAIVVGQGLLAGFTIRRLGEVRTIALSLGLTALPLALIALVPWEAAAMILLVVAVTANSVSQPAMSLLISRAAGPNRQGAMLGANAAASALAKVFGPVSSGLLFSVVSHDAPFLFAAVAMVPAIYFAFLGGGRMQNA